MVDKKTNKAKHPKSVRRYDPEYDVVKLRTILETTERRDLLEHTGIKMNEVQYRTLESQLASLKDVFRLHKAIEIDPHLLVKIYNQRVVSETKQRHHKLVRLAALITKKWKAGKSFLYISNNFDFPPVLVVKIILKELGWTKSRIKKALDIPEEISDERVREEVLEILPLDISYAPGASEAQISVGIAGEDALNTWLKQNKIEFRPQEELVNVYAKTPDFLLDKPLHFDGNDICWIESKATFASRQEMTRNYRHQLTHYVNMFGPGMVVYWFGYVYPKAPFSNVLVVTAEFFREWEAQGVNFSNNKYPLPPELPKEDNQDCVNSEPHQENGAE